MSDPYLLPNHPSLRVLDRFSLLDESQEDTDGNVSLWALLVHILQQPVANTLQLIDVLDTISNTIRASSGTAGDYGTLKAFVEAHHDIFFSQVWPAVVRLALTLPTWCPDGSLPVLVSQQRLQLSRTEAACLVAHQFLCTLQCPSWRDGYFDYSIWYNSGQRHPKAVDMYLTAFMTFMQSHDRAEAATAQSQQIQSSITYSIHSVANLPSDQDILLAPLMIEKVDAYSTHSQTAAVQGPHGAAVVSANKHIGFGQSATQEELFVGNCPESCPAVLVTPPLQDSQVLVVDGARCMLRILGQRRQIEWSVIEDETGRQGGRMLFMDALEIDEMYGEEEEGGNMPDLEAANMERELRKAYTAFSAYGSSTGDSRGTLDKVWTGVWGCGAFHGSPGVKIPIMWMAATLAKRELHVICDAGLGEFADAMEQVVRQMVNARSTVADMWTLLGRMPKDIDRNEAVRWLVRWTEFYESLM